MTTSRLKSGASLPEASLSGTAPAESAPAHLSWARWPAFLVIALLGLAVRLPQLGVRPMHTDEAINAYIVGQILAGTPFTYDPQDRHGPALAALAWPLAGIQGAKSFPDLTERELRLTSVMAGTITILLFGAAVEMFGFMPCLIAALLFAFSPLPVYYDRYFIHESLFCAATFGLILSGRRALKSRSIKAAILAGACAGVMFAAKETAVLHFVAMVAAAIVFWMWNFKEKSLRPSRLAPWIATVVTFVAIVAILFTWFGRNWKALVALLHLGPDVLARAGGQGHEKPIWYYGHLLTGGWSGALLVALASFGLISCLTRRDHSLFAWLAYYAILITAIYSLIPYKTPWLALNLWLPLSLFVGLAIESLWIWSVKHAGPNAAVPLCGVVVIFAGVLIAHDTRECVFVHPADEINPYAYAHTTDDILGLPAEIEDFAKRDGIASPRIAVIAPDPWPLPWYLRHFNQVGFWQPGQKVGEADFYITSTDAANQYADRLRNFRPDFFGVRPGVLILLWLPAPK